MTAVPLTPPRDAPMEALSPIGMARGLPTTAAGMAGELIARDGRASTVLYDGGIHLARIAVGCLIQPEPGDRVLIASADGALWVLTVLDRTSNAPVRLGAEGDIDIVSASGEIKLLAAESVTIDAGKNARIAAPEVELHAGIGRFVIEELTQVGRSARYFVDRIRSMGDVLESFAEHVLVKAKRGSRFIAESDQMRAGAIDHRAEGTLQLHAETSFITADTVVRVDADQIHMG
jgi:Protein of unknown function (DUF3540)